VAALVSLHWQKVGTIELVHDTTKNELGAAVPPCGRFGANAAWYRLSLLTYTVVSALKSLALPASLSAERPKRLRFTLFTLALRECGGGAPRWPNRGSAAARPTRAGPPRRLSASGLRSTPLAATANTGAGPRLSCGEPGPEHAPAPWSRAPP
jgi:hypothetical protein